MEKPQQIIFSLHIPYPCYQYYSTVSIKVHGNTKVKDTPDNGYKYRLISFLQKYFDFIFWKQFHVEFQQQPNVQPPERGWGLIIGPQTGIIDHPEKKVLVNFFSRKK